MKRTQAPAAYPPMNGCTHGCYEPSVNGAPTVGTNSPRTVTMNDHFTVADLAHALGVTKNAVMNRIRRGTLVAEKVGGAWRIPRDEYERCVNGAPTNRPQVGDEGGTHGARPMDDVGTHGAPTNGARPMDDMGTHGAPTNGARAMDDMGTHGAPTELDVMHLKLEAAEQAHEATRRELEALRDTFQQTQHQLGDALAAVRSLTDEVKGLTAMIHAHRALPSPVGWLRSVVRQICSIRV